MSFSLTLSVGPEVGAVVTHIYRQKTEANKSRWLAPGYPAGEWWGWDLTWALAGAKAGRLNHYAMHCLPEQKGTQEQVRAGPESIITT